MPATITAEQTIKMLRRSNENQARQKRMPKASWPRRSPRRSIPSPDPRVMMSQRICIEKPETNPNDFRYLFRKCDPGNANDPEFFWLNTEGEMIPRRTYPSVVQALTPMIRQGWEDATW